VVARDKRALLLRVHAHQLGREDLEDCYSQAVLELVAHVRAGGAYASLSHVGNSLALRFDSRVRDRRRALSGRSPMQAALRDAVPIGGLGDEKIAIADRQADVEERVMLRHDLRRIELLARELSPDQQLVLACELGLEASREQLCHFFGWSPAKYSKVAQRARTRLRGLMVIDERRSA
jgi:DNA-directed RNA polymerase specialized sigma24 family protein